MKFPSNHTSSDPLANQPTSSSLNADHEIEYLKMQVERLFMISEALWEFIKEKNGLEDSELFRMVMDIDAKDGRIDGKVAPQPTKCPECNHILPRTKPFCLYCGTYVVKKVFDH